MAKLPKNVKVVARVAGGLGVVQSVLWVVLGALALASYLNCGFNEPSDFQPVTSNFTAVIKNYFFLNEYCPTHRTLEGVISSFDLHAWAAATVATSALWLIMSSCLFVYVTDKNVNNVKSNLYAWSLLAVTVSSCDLALGILFGLSFGAVGELMDSYTPESGLPELFELSQVRGASLTMMVISLRGFVLLLVNVALVVAVLYCAHLINRSLSRNEHATHALGPLYAFNHGPTKNRPEPWSTVGLEYDNQHAGHINRAYSRSEHDKERSSWHLPPVRLVNDSRTESYYNNRTWLSDSYQRGNSKQVRQISHLEEPKSSSSSSSRTPQPDPLPPWKRSDPVDQRTPQPPPLPYMPLWKRDLADLNFPSPDYSPPQGRQPRLKSALKTTMY